MTYSAYTIDKGTHDIDDDGLRAIVDPEGAEFITVNVYGDQSVVYVRRHDLTWAQVALEPDDAEAHTIVAEAIDELPEEFRAALERVPVVVSQLGREHHAYGHYYGDTIARDNYEDRIVIYQDTLEAYEPPPLDDAIRQELQEYVIRRRAELGD